MMVYTAILVAGGKEKIKENNTSEDGDHVTELDDDMEDELCKLWDASMNEV